MEIPDSAREVIESGQLGHFVTLNRDGSPHVTIVWVGLDGEEIVIGKLNEDQKVANIRRDSRVSLSIEAPTGDQYGMKNYLVVEGTAHVTEAVRHNYFTTWHSATSDPGLCSHRWRILRPALLFASHQTGFAGWGHGALPCEHVLNH